MSVNTRPMYGEKPAAKAPVSHEYSSTQVQITGRPAELILKLGKQIPDRELAGDGRESEPHITAKYGLHFQTPSKRLRDALKEFGPVTLTLGKTSLFENPEADVLKVDVDSPDLHRLNKLISRIVPTHSTHHTYHPHATLAYLKPGKGKKYAGNTALVGHKITIQHVTFSGKKGHREALPLTGENAAYRAR